MNQHQEQAPKEFEGRLSPGKDWREIVAWVGDLPPMPHVASRAIQMVENPSTTAQELTDLLSSDTALAARVLKIANSAMFCRQREISTLNQAIMIIGFKALKGIIVAATLRQMGKSFGSTQRLIWENSMATAMCATSLSKKMKKRYLEEIFLLGLLHSLGQIVFLSQDELARQYRQVLALIKDKGLDYITAEQIVFGFAHPLIGALVAKKWNFSAETCQVILHYKDTFEGSKLESEQDEKTAIVQMAELMTHAASIGSPPGYPKDIEKILALAQLVGFGGESAVDEIEDSINETMRQFENEKHIYG
ncbi:MAG: HDOD domain-containing protein [Deltaproteobacteria bacterium]|nr:HDOD domain-containing protein [Deltaproteobacteria bacterium]